LFGDNHHHLAPLGPTRTIPEPSTLLKQPNMAIATSKHDKEEKSGSRKHLLGVLKGKDRQEEVLAPPPLVPKLT